MTDPGWGSVRPGRHRRGGTPWTDGRGGAVVVHERGPESVDEAAALLMIGEMGIKASDVPCPSRPAGRSEG